MKLMPALEAYTEDDFEFFQYFGAKRLDMTSSWAEKQLADIKKFKEARANIIIKADEPQNVTVDPSLTTIAPKTEKKELFELAAKVKIKPKTTAAGEEVILKDTAGKRRHNEETNDRPAAEKKKYTEDQNPKALKPKPLVAYDDDD
eukprot:TRINITY_DN697_c0_g1_i3.p1 TRINITY_DN697_c0_g1~~TRINITY_DN697_c0_g1_i3.p1  ORF type:complete len:146 (-),score=56.17 TRINITY_DN697_c0_g1_i3:91-528(-)